MANCLTHVEEPVLGACERCGDFVCRLDSELVEGKRYCKTCSTKSDVDWLEAYRRELWGKRDGFAYLYGVVGPLLNALQIAVLISVGASGPGGMGAVLPGVLAIAVVMANGIAYFFRVRAARWGVIVLPLLGGAATVIFGNRSADMPPLLIANLIALLFGVGAYQNPRSRLFFEIDITEAQLRKLWDTHKNNRFADYSVLLGILGLLVPGLAVLNALLALYALRQVDPNSRPPIGKKWRAVAGLVLSLAGIALWTFIFVAG